MPLILRLQLVENRLVDFLPRCRAHAFVELAMFLGIKLEEIQALHVQPLMSKTGNEAVRPWVLNETIDLSAQDSGVTQLLLLCQLKQLGIGRGTPQEIRQSHCQFKIVQGTRRTVLAGLFQEEKAGRREDHAEWGSNRDVELLINHQSVLEDFDQGVDELGLWFALSKRLHGEVVKNVPGALQIRCSIAGRMRVKDRLQRAGIPLRQGSFDFDPVHPNRGFMAIAVSIHRRIKVKLPQCPPARLPFPDRKLPFCILVHRHLGFDQFRIGRSAGHVQRRQGKAIQLSPAELLLRGMSQLEKVTKGGCLLGGPRLDSQGVGSNGHLVGRGNHDLGRTHRQLKPGSGVIVRKAGVVLVVGRCLIEELYGIEKIPESMVLRVGESCQFVEVQVDLTIKLTVVITQAQLGDRIFVLWQGECFL